MSDENKVISLGGEIDNNAPVVEEKKSEVNQTEVLATPFETPAEAYIPTPTEVQKVVDKKPEQTKKKRNKVLKGIIITLVVIILLVVLAAGALFFLIVYDDMPSAPTDVPTTSEVVTGTISDFMTDDGRMTFSTLEVNGIYKKIEPALQAAVADYATINESFIVLSDNKATYYARVNYKGVTLPIRISILINYEDPYITVTLDKAKVGQFTIPEKLITAVLANVELPEGISFDANNAKFSYDTTALNDIFIGFIRKNDFVSDIESFLDWGAGIFGGEYSYEDTFNITISECQVMENQLVFKIGSIFE